MEEAVGFQSDQKVKGLVYSKGSVHYYNPLDRIPTVQDIYPAMERIPSLWLQSPRAYHQSIRKEIIEQALAYKAFLNIKRNGQSVRFVPTKMMEERDSWAVQGLENRSEVILSSQDWEEMQLILPGINDNNEV
jgi:hypothetical protein